MNLTEAMRLLIAAQDDPVLAAWAAVVHEYRMAPMCDVSPYDHLAAFQELFSHGLITPHQYNLTDTRRIFFSGRRPSATEVQRVLDNLRRLPEPPAMEPSMAKSKFPSNPFGETALVAKENNGAVAQRATMLPSTTAAVPLNPFAPSREILPPNKQPLLDPFGSPAPSGLVCRDTAKLRGGAKDLMGDIDVQCFCCGVQLTMEVADMQAEGPDVIPGEHIGIVDLVLFGVCTKCNKEHHHSVAANVEHDRFR